MNCSEAREVIGDLLAEGISPSTDAIVRSHCVACADCAAYLREIAATYDSLRPDVQITASSGFKEKTMSRIAALSLPVPASRHRHTHLNYAKILAVAACIAAAVSVAPLLKGLKADSSAYALEQSIKATEGLRTIHLRDESANGELISEIWLEFDESRDLSRARMSWSQTEDGPKEVVWQKNVAEVWFKAKNSHLVTSESQILRGLVGNVREIDPREVLKKVKEQEAAGIMEVRVKQENGTTRLIVQPKHAAEQANVFTLDATNNVVTQKDQYYVDGWKLIGRTKYLDFNKPFSPEVFKLQMPADVTHVDDRKGEGGVEQGAMTKEEVAAVVAREFFEALVANDYEKAGSLIGGIKAADLRKLLGDAQFLKVVSIGIAQPHRAPETGGLQVPCEVQMSKDDKVFVHKFELGVRPMRNFPDKWVVFGGI